MHASLKRRRRGDRERGRTRLSAPTVVKLSLAVVALIAALLAGRTSYFDMATTSDYDQLSRRDGLALIEEDAAAPDWGDLLAQNEDTVGWLHVGGVDIDVPVVAPTGAPRQNWYLDHDFWGHPSLLGCPYLDHRSSVTGRHVMIYGHNQPASHAMFSPIHAAHQSDVFSTVGDATLYVPHEDATTFHPLMALRVHETYEPIQVFSLRAPEDVGALLESLRADASVVTEDALQRGARATRVLTLVTCSTGNANTSQRTLLVFCADV